MVYILPLSYTVSIKNLETELVVIKDALVDLEGLVELLHRFIDISDEDFVICYQNMRDFEVDSYSVRGRRDSEDPWEIRVVKNPIEPPRMGIWRKMWEAMKW